MKIAIHKSGTGFSNIWSEYCKEKNIPYKFVDCYQSDIIYQLEDCDALMWHFHQGSPKDMLFAKQLLYSVAASGKKIFPDFCTMWHFDDKIGQKYLLEAIGAPMVHSWIFYDRKEALDWLKSASYPVVFKLRGGAGSQNVVLVRDATYAKKLVKRAFGRGFSRYPALGSLKERIRKYRLGTTTFYDVAKGVARLFVPPPYARILGREKGYVYFQEFIPSNDHDIRVIVINGKAFAIKRMVRNNDFRASGSGTIHYDKENFNVETLSLAFDLAKKLKSQCVAFDFVYDNGNPLVVEISYGFSPAGYEPCPGYWDRDLHWHNGTFNPYGWMVETVLSS